MTMQSRSAMQKTHTVIAEGNFESLREIAGKVGSNFRLAVTTGAALRWEKPAI